MTKQNKGDQSWEWVHDNKTEPSWILHKEKNSQHSMKTLLLCSGGQKHFKNKQTNQKNPQTSPLKANLRSKEKKCLHFWLHVVSLEAEKWTCPWSLAELGGEPRPPAKPFLPAFCTKQLVNLRVILFQFSGYLGWCNILAAVRWIIINFLEPFPVLCFL